MKYIVLVAAVLCLWSSVARAKTAEVQIVGRSAECIVDRGVGVFDVPVNPKMITALSFPGKLKSGMLQGDPPRGFKLRRSDDALFIWPRGKRLDATASFAVTVEDPFMHVVLLVRVTDDPDKALKACRFVARDAKEVEQRRIATEAAKIATEAEREATARYTKFEEEQRKLQRDADVAMIKERLSATGELVPVVREMRYAHGTNGRLAVQLGRALFHKGDLWTTFSIETSQWQPLRLANVQLVNKDGTIIPLKDVSLDPPARPHAEALAEIPQGRRVTGLMRLPGLAEGAEPLEITFTGFTGARMVAVTAEEPVWVWVPRREDELREEQRREAELRAARGVVSLSVQGTYGAIWLGDGTGADLSDATSLKGLGVRATYGISPMIAVEAEIMGGSTGSARFESVTYQGAQGDLTRSAWLGRAQFGGVLRLGKDIYVPLLRLGVGLQGANHSGTLTTASGEVEGPDPFELTFLFAFGAGLDVRLGPIRVGIALSGLTPFGDYELSRRSIEAGLHLGYSWKP